MMLMKTILSLALLFSITTAKAEQGVAFGKAVGHLIDQPDAWFSTDQGKQTIDNLVSWQNPNGGWWKSYDATHPRPPEVLPRPATMPAGDNPNVWQQVSTIDNDATYSEARIMARAFRVLKDEKYKDSFQKCLQYLWAAQYPNGGWPQRFPLQENYGRHITFNDDAMAGVMDFMSDVAAGQGDFAFVSPADRKRARESFDKGIDCILNCQIKKDGKPTVWCQQHDEITLQPAYARAYELPSFSGNESCGLTLLLMRLEHPDARTRAAVEGAVAWLDAHKITGLKVQHVTGDQYEGKKDVIATPDPQAEPVWARYYDLDTGKPYFCGRDAVKKDSLEQIEHERRVGYAWYGTWPAKVLKAYPKWKARVGE